MPLLGYTFTLKNMSSTVTFPVIILKKCPLVPLPAAIMPWASGPVIVMSLAELPTITSVTGKCVNPLSAISTVTVELLWSILDIIQEFEVNQLSPAPVSLWLSEIILFGEVRLNSVVSVTGISNKFAVCNILPPLGSLSDTALPGVTNTKSHSPVILVGLLMVVLIALGATCLNSNPMYPEPEVSEI